MLRVVRAWGGALSQAGGDLGSEVIDPAPNGLVRDDDPALREQILDVAIAEREPEIQSDRLLNDLRRVAGVADFLHSFRYRAVKPVARPKRRDNASSTAFLPFGAAL
jgi:hypothetical protein